MIPSLRGERVVHIADVRETETFRNKPIARKRLEVRNIRTWLAVALRREGKLLGVINVHRHEVRPFSEKQIALLESFAAQAVIAMENARLLTETREALEQQTATAEVLGIINSSPGDLAPVFEAILDKAHTLCGATLGSLFLFDGELFRATATYGYPEDLAQRLREGVVLSAAPQLLMDDVRWVHNPDLTLIDTPTARAVSGRGGVRTNLMLPLRKDGRLLGAISCNRQEVRPFTDKEIALLENFAAQAVIAMENARLLNELRERTRDLRGVARIPDRDQRRAQGHQRLDLRLAACARHGGRDRRAAVRCRDGMVILRRDGEVYRAGRGGRLPARIQAFLQLTRSPPGAARSPGASRWKAPDGADRRCRSGSGLYFNRSHDTRAAAHRAWRASNARRRANRRHRAGAHAGSSPSPKSRSSLVRTFADQAVIAIENTRLITETHETLEQQTATAEVLQVINSSPGDLVPVFEAMLDKAMRLSEAAFGQLAIYEDGTFRTAATRGMPAAFVEYRRRSPPDYGPGTQPARLLAGKRVIHVPDLMAEDIYETGDPNRRALVDLGGVRSSLMVPLLRDDAVLGFINIYRQEPRPFTGKQIALLESFAAQAVIAMDNARLLDEIRQRQAELRVTFDNMGDGVAMFDGDHRLAAWNLNFQRILDLPDALLAERPSYTDYIYLLAERGEFGSDDLEAELSRRLAETGQVLRLERTRPDGRVIEVRRNAVPGGGFVLIYSDITERKRAEQEIRTARDTAETALRELQAAQASLLHAQKMAALGQLTAGIAHEIKNPLNFVNNFAGLSVELLEELKETAGAAIATLPGDERGEVDELVEMLTGNLGKIAEHGRRADGIVKSMLAHSRGGSGEWRAVDVNSLIEEALNLAYHGARAQDQEFNITLEREFGRGIAPIELVAQDMTRVFLNLFGNGFYATDKRRREEGSTSFRPVLKVATHDLGDGIEITVRDNGTGIPPEVRDRLFQPFFTTKPTGEGTGLGLSISWDIVTQQHGGTIAVDSRVGEFTEFTIRLPRIQPAPPAEAEA